MFACEEIPQAANDNVASCIGCGNKFNSRFGSRYCSRSCSNKSRAKEPIQETSCAGCGVAFRRRPNSKDAAKYCSRSCAFSSGAAGRPRLVSAENREFAAKQIVSYSIVRCKCVDCDVWFTSKSIQSKRCDGCLETNRQRYFDRHWGIDRSLRKCPECHAMFVPPYGRGQARYCSNECSSKKNKRVGRSKRRARERHADNDNIDPFVVFDRDGWRCQLCNIKTPRKLRGTYAPNAPELDHIIPLAAGGSHTYINTQCACRSCNALKSDTPLGQLRLFG